MNTCLVLAGSLFGLGLACGLVQAESSVAHIDVHTHLISGELPVGIGGRRSEGGKAQDSAPGGGRSAGQAGRGLGSQGARGGGGAQFGGYEGYCTAADKLVAVMDRLGVKYAVVMCAPKTTKNQGPPNDFSDLARAVERHPGRLFLGGGGESLNPIIHSVGPGAVSEAVLAKFDQAVEALVRRQVKCFGEMAVLHLSYSEQHVFEQCAPDHPLFLRLADHAARTGIPVDLHMDCIPADTATPALWRKLSSRNPESLAANIPGLERLLAHNRGARIVWQHVGRDTGGQLTPELLRGLLTRHTNLYCALWARHEQGPVGIQGPPGPNQIVDGRYQLKAGWSQLFTDFPDRFMIGTDAFLAARTEHLDTSIEGTWKFIDLLPQDLRGKIGGANAARVYRMP